jgi:Fe2+ transport system protein FeoA
MTAKTPCTVPLTSLAPGDAAQVVNLNGKGAFRRRLLDLGFVAGALVRVIKHAPLQNPIEYCIGSAHVTLRREEAEHILVQQVPVPDWCRESVADGGRHRNRKRHRWGPRWLHRRTSR